MLILLLACNANSTEPITHADADWNDVQMWKAFDELVNLGLPNVFDAFEQYTMLYDEGATLDCPGDGYNFNSPDVQDYGCTSETGFAYCGAAEVRYEQGGWSFSCDCRIDSPDGRRFEGAGNIVQYSDDGGGVLETFLDIRGTYQTNYGPEWLQRRPSSVLSIFFGSEFQLTGGYTIGDTSVYFNDISFRECDYGFGRLDIRDPSGGWWYFDRSEKCDSSGTLSFNGDEVAKNVNKDLRPLLDAMYTAMLDVAQ